jgi:hypothetical protein
MRSADDERDGAIVGVAHGSRLISIVAECNDEEEVVGRAWRKRLRCLNGKMERSGLRSHRAKMMRYVGQ